MSELLRIKEVIREHHLTMEEVAERIGINSSSLSMQVNGNPTIKSLHKMAVAIGCDIKDLIR